MEVCSAPSPRFLVAMEEGVPAHTTATKKVAKHVHNPREDDLVLLRCKDAPRNNWLLARITKTQVDQDGEVCSVELVSAKEGSMRRHQRPVAEATLLKAED